MWRRSGTGDWHSQARSNRMPWWVGAKYGARERIRTSEWTAKGAARCRADAGRRLAKPSAVRIDCPGGSPSLTGHGREDSDLRGGSDSARGSAWEQAPGEPASGGDRQRRHSPPDAPSTGGRSRSSLRSIAESEPLWRRTRPAHGAAGCVRIRRPGGSAPNTEHQREDPDLRVGP